MDEKQRNKLMGIMVEHQGLLKGLSTSDGQWAIQNPKQAIALYVEAIKNRNKYMSVVFENEYLKLISGNETLVIDQCDGSRVIADAGDVFDYIDPDFRNWKADEVGQATLDTPVNVCELVKDGTFSDFFGSLSPDMDKLCFTQDQIIGFVKKQRGWLQTDGCATFFLFKSHNKFFVADVGFNSVGRLVVVVNRLEDDYVWDAEGRHRVVVPQLVA